MAAAHCYAVRLVCYAVTPGGLSEYVYEGSGVESIDDERGEKERGGEERADGGGGVQTNTGMPGDVPTLRLCLHRSHYWSTKPIGSSELVCLRLYVSCLRTSA